MKRDKVVVFLLLCLTYLVCSTEALVGLTADYTVEAETGVLGGGVKVEKSISGYSGTGYVTNFTNSADDKVTVKINVSTQGFYKLVIRYQSDYKEQNLYVNGSGPSKIVFTKTSVFADADAGKYLFKAGENTITVQANWGWINIDKFSLYAVPKNSYNITSNLINPNATDATRDLYAYLLSNFNKSIISGQTDDYFTDLKAISVKTPMIRGFDFQHYTRGYAYLWDHNTNGHTFGWEDNGTTQKAIDWYNQTNGKGIVTFHWHWHSPSGGTAGTNTFYTDMTSFDVTRAVETGTQENTDILRDIDSIATQLEKLQAAGVPVLWRPLHEAGGGWFWWGAKGAVPCKKLYNILYDRLTNYHSLNNLIWVWSTPESDWFPGGDSIDIIGYDSYPGKFNYDPQKSMFDALYNLVNGEKLIAMTENGPIPNPHGCLSFDAPWAYFMSWSNLVQEQNTNTHITEVFNNPYVLTIENPLEISYIKRRDQTGYTIFPNPAQDHFEFTGNTFESLEIRDLTGRLLKSFSGVSLTSQLISLKGLKNGNYIVRVVKDKKEYQYKLVVLR